MAVIEFYPREYQFAWTDVPKVGTWVENLLPVGGTVLLFGPAGTGKTTLAAHMLNCIENNEQFLGRNTNTTKCMMLSLDTPKNILVRRWLDSVPPFQKDFAFCPTEPFDCLNPDFKTSQIYTTLKAHVQAHDIKIIVVDSLRDCFKGELVDDENPKGVYGAFKEWFGDATVVFVHHTRKQQFAGGKLVEGSIDDEATGSKYWVNKAQVALYLRKVNQYTLKLDMGKSQCFAPWDESITLQMDNMTVTEYDEADGTLHRAAFNAGMTALGAMDPNFHALKMTEKMKRLATHLNINERTVWKWKVEARQK